MVAARDHCTLCGQPVPTPVRGDGGAVYCCHACREVAALLAEPQPEIVQAGQAGEIEQLDLHVGGLWCSSCAWLVEERLIRVPGVSSARVSYLERSARVRYDSSRLQPDDIRRRIRGFGYRASLEPDPEEGERFFTRLLVGGLLAMHIMVTSIIIYARDALGLSTPEAAWLEQFFYLMQAVVSLPLAFVLGLPVLRAGVNGLLRGLPNVQTLVMIGALAALGLSTRNLLAGSGHVYFDTAAMLFFLVTLGRWFEMKAHHSGRASLIALQSGLPEEARLLTPDGEVRIDASSIRPGQQIRTLPGEHIPADGLVAAGEGEIDESMLTGEPHPALRRAGDPVYAGTIHLDGAFDIVVSHAGAWTRAGRIRDLLEKLVWERSPSEKLADRVAARLVYAAFAIAALTFAGYYFTTGLERALLTSLSVLLIACPCALGIASPLTMRAAVGRAAENGVLPRSGGLLESLASVRRVFFDKTGTLTRLPLHVLKTIHAVPGDDLFVAKAAALEGRSSHPFARAICEYAGRSSGTSPSADDFKNLPGMGVTGCVGDVRVWVGNRRLMEEHGLAVPEEMSRKAARAGQAGSVVIYTGWEDCVQGAFVIGESVRPEAAESLADLQSLGVETAVLTGDSSEAGVRWSERLGIPVHAGLQPEDKLAIIAEDPGHTAMVGDGINDGPALAAAAVGIAVQRGTDLARSASGITLLDGDLRLVPWLFRLAHETRHRLRRNMVWAGVYNVLGIGLAVAGLLQPVLAALAMVLSSLIVTQSALQLRRFPGPQHSKEPGRPLKPAPTKPSTAQDPI